MGGPHGHPRGGAGDLLRHGRRLRRVRATPLGLVLQVYSAPRVGASATRPVHWSWSERLAAAGGDDPRAQPAACRRLAATHASPSPPGDRRFLDPRAPRRRPFTAPRSPTRRVTPPGCRRASPRSTPRRSSTGPRAPGALGLRAHCHPAARPCHRPAMPISTRSCATAARRCSTTRALPRRARRRHRRRRDVAAAVRAMAGQRAAGPRCRRVRRRSHAPGLVADLAWASIRWLRGAGVAGCGAARAHPGRRRTAFDAGGQLGIAAMRRRAAPHATRRSCSLRAVIATAAAWHRPHPRSDAAVVVPDGAASARRLSTCASGSTTCCPLVLESRLQRAVVIGEDLGVVPDGLADVLAPRACSHRRAAVHRRRRRRLLPRRAGPQCGGHHPTHDLSTLAGWRTGSRPRLARADRPVDRPTRRPVPDAAADDEGPRATSPVSAPPFPRRWEAAATTPRLIRYTALARRPWCCCRRKTHWGCRNAQPAGPIDQHPTGAGACRCPCPGTR